MAAKEIRPWIVEVRAQAAADTAKHHEAWARNWEAGKGERLAGKDKVKVPCESCGSPILPNKLYEHSLCGACIRTKSQSFLDWIRAKELCKAALQSAEAKGAREVRRADRSICGYCGEGCSGGHVLAKMVKPLRDRGRIIGVKPMGERTRCDPPCEEALKEARELLASLEAGA